VGALLVCVLLFFGLGAGISLTAAGTEDMDRLASNLGSEFPHALNIGINVTDPPGTLYNFTQFSVSKAGGRRIDLDCGWVLFREQGGDLNVSVGNFMGSRQTFGIEIDGSQENIQADDMAINSSLFTVSGHKFNATITVASSTTGAELLLNKTSLYMKMSLSRGGNVLKKEILA
jgi:hypothetical protein